MRLQLEKLVGHEHPEFDLIVPRAAVARRPPAGKEIVGAARVRNLGGGLRDFQRGVDERDVLGLLGEVVVVVGPVQGFLDVLADLGINGRVTPEAPELALAADDVLAGLGARR